MVLATSNALAQDKPAAPAVPSDKPAKHMPSGNEPLAPRFVVPSPENILILIRSTLLCLNQAMQTGNYTVLRDLASPSFREANSAGKLYHLFTNLEAQGISLAAVAILSPQLLETPNIDANGHLHVRGYFPGDPVRIDFDLVFEALANQWRVLALTVMPVRSAPIAMGYQFNQGDMAYGP